MLLLRSTGTAFTEHALLHGPVTKRACEVGGHCVVLGSGQRQVIVVSWPRVASDGFIGELSQGF